MSNPVKQLLHQIAGVLLAFSMVYIGYSNADMPSEWDVCTVDFDGPASLAAYARLHRALPPNWTISAPQIRGCR